MAGASRIDALITLTKLRDLELSAASSADRPLHLSAASGLVFTDRHFYVVADDELHLGVFDSGDTQPGHLVRLFAGELPPTKKKRKAHKPDLEVLMRLPPFAGHPHGALLALGSGSKDNRRLGALLESDAQGATNETPRVIDLAILFANLEDQVGDLNIEGGMVNGNELQLLQRGNKGDGRNALIRFPLAALFDMLGNAAGTVRIAPLAICPVDLGSVAGTPLCFTDGAALPNGDIVFSAVAENTEDSYNDGPCLGAALGVMDRKGNARSLHLLDQRHKIEGIDASVESDVVRLRLVTDADDAAIPAGLFSATLTLD